MTSTTSTRTGQQIIRSLGLGRVVRPATDTSNGGVSTWAEWCPVYTELQLGAMSIAQAADLPADTLVLVTKQVPHDGQGLPGQTRQYVEPITRAESGGWQFGGAYVECPPRLRDITGERVLPLHDRQEPNSYR